MKSKDKGGLLSNNKMVVKVILLSFQFFVIISIVCGDKQSTKRTTFSNHSKIDNLEIKLQRLAHTISKLTTKVVTQESKISIQDATIKSLKEQLSAIGNARRSGVGETFIRWGRSICPANVSEIVYTGYAGGSWYQHPGGAAEYLCMPSQPQWHHHTRQSSSAFVYGVEYSHLLTDSSHNYDDTPCAVCRTTTSSSVLMIPGRLHCYSGWKRLYAGFLAAGHYAYQGASQYICVDDHPTFEFHGSTVDYGKLLEPVSSRCGSLPCPPYKELEALTCVVCTV